MSHIKSSLTYLFPLLETDGIHLIEDLCACYWKQFGGGYNSKENFFHVVGKLTNDMHHWYHGSGITRKEIGSALGAIHIHDSIIVPEKELTIPPVHSQMS